MIPALNSKIPNTPPPPLNNNNNNNKNNNNKRRPGARSIINNTLACTHSAQRSRTRARVCVPAGVCVCVCVCECGPLLVSHPPPSPMDHALLVADR